MVNAPGENIITSYNSMSSQSKLCRLFLWCCHECLPRLNLNIKSVSESTTKIIFLTLTKSGIRGTIQ
jgi:hypothetical protein